MREAGDIVHTFQMYDTEHKILAPNGICITLVNMNKSHLDYADECKARIARLCSLIVTSGSSDESPEKLGGEEFKDITKASEIAYFERQKRLKYEIELIHEMDNLALIKQNYKDGKAEGLAEGKAEQNRIVAKAFLCNGVLPEIVSKSTGLSIEELSEL